MLLMGRLFGAVGLRGTSNMQRQTPAQQQEATLLRVLLGLVTLVSGFIGSVNIWLFDAYVIASFNFGTGLVTGCAYLWYRHYGVYTPVAWLFCLTLALNLLLYLWQAGGTGYTLMWLVVLPPMFFFLLGRVAGAWLSALMLGGTALYMWLFWRGDSLGHFSPGALLNVTEVFIVLWALLLYYERSRSVAYRELEKLTHTDKLTGLMNRFRLDDKLQELQERSARTGAVHTVLLADIDRFKRINDTYGHPVGDQVLQTLATAMAQTARRSDYVGRWGGEEFMVLLPDTPLEQARELAERLRKAVQQAEYSFPEGVTMSCGLAALSGQDAAPDVVARADQALYEAKRAGRNQVAVFNTGPA